MTKFFNTAGPVMECTVVARATKPMELTGVLWHIVAYPQYSFSDRSKVINYFWAVAIPCKDGFRRNGETHYGTCETMEQVRDMAVKAGYQLI